MITVNHRAILRKVRVISVRGELLPGSAGSDEAVKIRSVLNDLEGTTESIVFDFTGLEYTYGHLIAGVFFHLRGQGIDFNIVASGQTKKALISLIESSQIRLVYPVNVFENIDDAVRQFAIRP
jgi:hypothetical protein